MNNLFKTLFLSLLIFVGGCDFYTFYFIKKTLEGDLSYVDKVSSKYSLKGNSFSDIPITEEEKILPEFVEDKIQPLESEKDMFVGGSDRVETKEVMFVNRGEKLTLSLPNAEGVWIIKKYPILIGVFSKESSPKDNKYVFEINNFGKDSAVFQLFSTNGIIVKNLEYEINVISRNSKNYDILDANIGNESIEREPVRNVGFVRTNAFNETNLSFNSSVRDFDITDNEKEETNKVLDPNPPSDVSKLDLKSLVGNETKYFEYIDTIANKYGYYRALREIDRIETNVSQSDLPKLKLKKMELLGALRKYVEAIKEGEQFIDKDNFIKLYSGIFWGMSGNYMMADRYIKESLQKISVPSELNFALSKALDYYTKISEPITKDMLNFLLQRNEFIAKDFKNNYYTNLIYIGILFERIGEVYKAKAIYDRVFSSDVEESIKKMASDKIQDIERIINY